MEERRSRLSSMAWKRLQPYSYDRLIPQNSMSSNFCHVLNDDITSLELLYNSKNGDSFVAITYENDKLVLEEQHDSYSEL